MKSRVTLSSIFLIALAASALAQTASIEAFDNATVQPAGPRGGSSGKAFFNVQGNANGNFASFGVADFQFSGGTFNPGLTDVTGFKLSVTSSLAGFSVESGPCDVFICDDTTTSIQPGLQVYFDNFALPNGIGTPLGNRWYLGSFTFVGNGNGGVSGTVYEMTASSIPAAAKTYLLNQLNNNQTIRVIVAPGDELVDGSFAGYTNFTYDGPVLEISASSGTTLSGNILFNSYDGPDITSVLVEYKDATYTVVHSETASVDANGNFTVPTPLTAGNYYVSIQSRNWLRRTVGTYDTSSNVSGVTFDLINGDTDFDNEVNLVDYAAVSAAFGSVDGDSNWNPNADLDGDGEVNLVDASIVSSNFGQAGDE